MKRGKISKNNSDGRLVRKESASDITGQAIPRPGEYYAALLEVSNALASTLDLKTVLQKTTDSITELMRVKRSAIYLFEGESMYLWAATPPLDPQMPDAFRRARISDHPHIQEGMTTGQPVLLPDTVSADLTAAERDISEALDLRTVLYLPLMVEGKAMGTLNVATVGEPREISRAEIDMCHTLANLAALNIQKARLFEAIKQHAIDLERQVAKRKQAEEELRTKQYMLSEAQRIAHIGSWDTNIATGEITWSDEMYRIYRVSPDTFEPTAEAFLKLIHPDDQAAMRGWIKATFSGKKEPGLDFRILLPDGTVRHIRGSGEAFFDETGNPTRVIGTAQDMTEGKRGEETQRGSEERFRLAFTNAPIGMAIVGLDESIVQVNPALCTILGYTEAELTSRKVPDISHPDDRKIEETYKRMSREGVLETFQIVKRYIHADGHSVIGELSVSLVRDARGNPQYYIGQIEDITERKHAEEELRVAQKRFEDVLNSLDSLVYAVDMKTYEVLFINKYGKDNWGNIEGKICWQTIQKDKSAPCEFCTNNRLTAPDGKPSGTVVWEFQNTVNQRWYDCRDRAIYWPDGRLVRIEIATDITQRKLAEEELLLANRELYTLNRIITESSHTLETRQVLEIALDEALGIVGLEGGTICMLSEDGILHLEAERNTSEATKEDLRTNKIRVGECLCGSCALEHKPLILKSREEVLEFSTREVQRGEDIRFHAAFPLITKDKTLGVLCVFTYTDVKPPERSLKLLETFTMQISLTLENARLYEQVRDQVVELEKEIEERKKAQEELNKLNNALEQRVKERTAELENKNAELEKFNKVFVGRELRMIELKKQIAQLEKRIGGTA